MPHARGIEIQRRLKEIAAKEDRLMKLLRACKRRRNRPTETRPAPSAAPKTPVEMPTSSRFKISEFTY